jgi:hypothetical protein
MSRIPGIMPRMALKQGIAFSVRETGESLPWKNVGMQISEFLIIPPILLFSQYT